MFCILSLSPALGAGQRQRRYAKINEWSYCPPLARGVSFVMWRDAVDTTVSIITVGRLVGWWGFG